MNSLLEILLDVVLTCWVICGIVLPPIYLGSRFSQTFLKKRYWFLILFFQIIAGHTFQELIHFFIPIFYYYIFNRVDKREKRQSLLLSLFLFLLYRSTRYLIITLFIRMIFNYGVLPEEVRGIIHVLFNLLGLIGSSLLLRYFPIDWELFFSKKFQTIVQKSFYLFIPLTMFRIFSSFMTNINHTFYEQFDTTVSLMIFMAFFIWLLCIRQIQQNYRDLETIKRQETENRSMQQMVDQLGSLFLSKNSKNSASPETEFLLFHP